MIAVPPPPLPAGLGPTLEFYTLLSHELQRKSLGIWRHDASAAGGAGAGATGTAAGALVEEAKQAAAAAAAADASGGAGAQAAAAARSAAGPGPLAGELEAEKGQLSESVRAGDLVYAPQGLFPAPLPPGQRGEDSKRVGPPPVSTLLLSCSSAHTCATRHHCACSPCADNAACWGIVPTSHRRAPSPLAPPLCRSPTSACWAARWPRRCRTRACWTSPSRRCCTAWPCR